MPSTADSFAQALLDYRRKSSTPQSLTDLENFDPTAALQQYGAAATGDFQKQFGQDVTDLRGAAAGAGRLKTGFYDQDVGRLATSEAAQVTRDLAGQAMNAASLKAGTLESATGTQEEEQNRYLDLLSGQLDREQAARNAKQQGKSSLFGALGSIGGAIAGGPIGAAAGKLLLSSERFKDNIKPLEGASETLDRLPAKRFTYKGDDQPQVGVMAEDVDRELPEASVRDEQGRPTAVDYTKVLPLVLEATREQGEQIRQLRGELDRLMGGGRLGAPPPEEDEGMMPPPRRPGMMMVGGGQGPMPMGGVN
jgi:hypothetical protein